MTVSNKYGVDSGQWQKWNKQQKALFNNVYADIKRIGSDLFFHPVTVQRNLTDEEFDIVAWNAAWTAAHILKDGSFPEDDKLTTLHEGEVIAVNRIPARAG